MSTPEAVLRETREFSGYAFCRYGNDAYLYNGVHDLETALEQARKDSVRLDFIIDQSNAGYGWLQDHVWDDAPMSEFSEDARCLIRRAIDAAIRSKTVDSGPTQAPSDQE